MIHVTDICIITFATYQITLVWDNLPEQLQKFIDISKYQYCNDHYNFDRSSDIYNGPPPPKIFCYYCKVQSIHYIVY